jgi:hypothetical protein
LDEKVKGLEDSPKTDSPTKVSVDEDFRFDTTVDDLEQGSLETTALPTTTSALPVDRNF